MTNPSLFAAVSCLDGFDPESLSVDRAREAVLSLVAPVGGRERVFVRQALGRVLAEDVVSPIDVPAHDNSAMDGWAVRHADLAAAGETRLAIAGTAFAGRAFAAPVPPGGAVRIMTGAMLPEDADCIVVQEVARQEGDFVVVPPGQRPNQNLRRRGEDLAAGRPALAAGKRLRPAEVGLAASLGIAEVSVRRRLRVAVFSTGDELCSIGSQAREGEIYDSNRYTLGGMLARLGCEVLDMGVVRDDPALLEAAFREAARQADAVITSGGVSVGEADFVKAMMARLGEVAFWKIAMKPGRPMAFGRIADGDRQAWLFGLPGNPVAVMVTFYQFVRPALLAMAGALPEPLPSFRVPCTEALKKGRGRTEFQRGVLFQDGGAWKVRPTGAQGSGILRSMSDANCFIVLEPERANVQAGEEVTVQPMEGLA